MPLKASESFYYNPSPAYLLSPCTRTRLGDPSPISLASAVRGPFARAPALALELARAGQLQLQLTHPHSHMHAGAHVHVHTNRHHTHAHARTRTRTTHARFWRTYMHLHPHSRSHVQVSPSSSSRTRTRTCTWARTCTCTRTDTTDPTTDPHAAEDPPIPPHAGHARTLWVGGGAGAIVGRVHTSPSSRKARHDHELDGLKFGNSNWQIAAEQKSARTMANRVEIQAVDRSYLARTGWRGLYACRDKRWALQARQVKHLRIRPWRQKNGPLSPLN